MAEHQLPKLRNAGSIPVIRSKRPPFSAADRGEVREPLRRLAEQAHLKMRDLR